MGHQDEIGLQEKQRAAIRAEVVKVQTRFIDMQWQLSEEGEKMANLLRAVPIDEAKVLEQADKVMTLEREVEEDAFVDACSYQEPSHRRADRKASGDPSQVNLVRF